MPFKRPTLAALIERIGADIASRFPGADARLRRSNLAVLTRVEAGVAHGLYGYADRIARQIIVDTADTEYLERWGSIWGVARRSAIAATGNVLFTGVAGTVVPVGVVLQRADGAEYETTLPAVISGLSPPSALIPVKARMAGEAGNAGVNTALALAAQILGVSGSAYVDVNGLSSGAEVESDASLLQRVLTRIQQPPHGGADFDYVEWALEVPGVTRAWVYPLWMGAGTVGVFFVRDSDVSVIPDAGEVAAVQAYIDARRPVTAEVFVQAPVPLVVDVELSVSPDTPAVRAAVAAELADVFRREAQPGRVIRRTHLSEAISLAAGEDDHTLVSPALDVVAAPGQMPQLGSVSWL